MANANNERSNNIRENLQSDSRDMRSARIDGTVLNDAERYYEQKYLQILKVQEQLMGSEHKKLLKDESFLDRIV